MLFAKKIFWDWKGSPRIAYSKDTFRCASIKTGNPSRSLWKGSRCGWAASYFPTVSRSIIAAAGLNFSVRNGKRCAPAQWPPLGLSFSGLDRKGRGTGTKQRESDTGGSARAISAARLNVSPRSHLRPIDVVVSDGPQRRPHLGAGFALRCLQRLSPPDAATRPCAWRRNRLTVGPSVPVLSY